MKTARNILIAFILNLFFAIFEFAGGIVTGSVAIISDAIHDLGDAASIGVSYFLEKISKKQPDETYTYGYGRFSVMGSVFTTLVLLLGSCLVIYHAVERLIHPVQIHYMGMLIFAVVGVLVNFCAAVFTREGDSMNQKAVNLHMLEDMLGWIVVLVGAAVMRFTDFLWIDPVMSMGVAVFILIHAVKNLMQALELFLEKTPQGIHVHEIREHILEIAGVLDVHHIHIWSMDGSHHYATMHVKTAADPHTIKAQIRRELSEHGIGHVTLELEEANEHCHHTHCHVDHAPSCGHHHHHHHHHH